MLFDTIPFTNIDVETFIGTWDREDYIIQSGETRFFPSELSKHFSRHLAEKIIRRELNKFPKMDRYKRKEELEKEILGEEMKTKDDVQKTFKQKVEEHEKLILSLLAEREKMEKAKKIEAFEIIDKDV